MSDIAQQQTQVTAPATDAPARHGGSFVGLWVCPAGCPRSIAAREGHGQDPAQDGSQTASLTRAAAPRLHERLAAEALAADRVSVAPAPAQAAGGAAQRVWLVYVWDSLASSWGDYVFDSAYSSEASADSRKTFLDVVKSPHSPEARIEARSVQP